MEYTKGEWEADIRVGCVAVHIKDDDKYNCLDGARNDCIFWANGYRTENTDGSFKEWNVNPEDVANAHLIAAAPDMYEALKGLMRDYSTNPNSDIFYAACLKAREALTKAEGKGE